MKNQLETGLMRSLNQIKMLSKISGLPSFTHSKNFNGTVSVISSDPPCKDDNARLTMVFLKP